MYDTHIEEYKIVPVDDDWYPNFPDNNIEVHLHIFHDSTGRTTGYVLMTALGMDDNMMSLEYKSNDLSMLKFVYNSYKVNIYDKIIGNVNHQWFRERGFLPF